jgi:hypothetical protein
MSIKFFKPTDPVIAGKHVAKWIRDNFKIIEIEQIDNGPSAYFIYGFKEPLNEEQEKLRVVVKHKFFFKEHFNNYDKALAVINKVKGTL